MTFNNTTLLTTFGTTLTTTITTTIKPIIKNISTIFTNYTPIISTTYESLVPVLQFINNTTNDANDANDTNDTNSTTNNQPPDSSDSSLSTSYIALLIALIGLFSTVIVRYNIKKIKICCINLECKKTQKDVEPYENDEEEFSENYYVVNNHRCNHSNHSNHSSKHGCKHSNHISNHSSIIRTTANTNKLILETIV